ncbi:unnamed protein product [Ascophyllum nodosum]
MSPRCDRHCKSFYDHRHRSRFSFRLLRNGHEERREIIFNAPAGRKETHKDTVELEGEYQSKRGGISLEAQAGGEKMVGVKMEPERTMVKSSYPRAGAGVKAPEQPRLSCREM